MIVNFLLILSFLPPAISHFREAMERVKRGERKMRRKGNPEILKKKIMFPNLKLVNYLE